MAVVKRSRCGEIHIAVFSAVIFATARLPEAARRSCTRTAKGIVGAAYPGGRCLENSPDLVLPLDALAAGQYDGRGSRLLGVAQTFSRHRKLGDLADVRDCGSWHLRIGVMSLGLPLLRSVGLSKSGLRLFDASAIALCRQHFGMGPLDSRTDGRNQLDALEGDGL